MQDQVWLEWGDLVESAVWSAKRDWREAWAKGTAIQDLLATHVTYVETVITERPGGRLEVLVRVIARKAHQREVFLYKFAKSAGVWTQTDGV